MQEFIINVTEIEELQTIKDTGTLDSIFEKAKRTIVGGGTVILVRKQADGKSEKFDEMSTLENLTTYKNWVYKYL